MFREILSKVIQFIIIVYSVILIFGGEVGVLQVVDCKFRVRLSCGSRFCLKIYNKKISVFYFFLCK